MADRDTRTTKHLNTVLIRLAILAALLSPISIGPGCSGGSGGGASSYTVGGTVSGLDGTLVLRVNGGHDLTITQDGTFTFNTSFQNQDTFTVTLASGPVLQNTALQDATGTISGSNAANVAISCADKAWTHPASLGDSISLDGTVADNPRIAMSGAGTAIVTWFQSASVHEQVYHGIYTNAAWSLPELFEDNISPAGTSATYPAVATDDSGDIIVAWEQSDGTNWQIYKSECRDGTWTHPTGLTDFISVDGYWATDVQVAMNNQGEAVIVWVQDDGSDDMVFISEYRSGSWTHPSGIFDCISPSGEDCINPRVAMDDNGDVIIVWTQSDGAVFSVFKSECRGGVWTHPTLLADNITADGLAAGLHEVAMDNSGNAIITYVQTTGVIYNVYKCEYRNGAWTFPVDWNDYFSNVGSTCSFAQPAMDDNGNAIIVWTQTDGIRDRIFKAEYRSGSWSYPADAEDYVTPDGMTAKDPRVAMDDSGNAVIVWTQFSGPDTRILMSEYRKGAWSHPAGLDSAISPLGVQASSPQVCLDGNGNALIVWTQSDGSVSQIYLSEFR